ncbi:hypothetical protein CANCADRAFT_148540 [Tortispora caseinolytica NRRL Y-17796]|uniref:RNA 3'-terminal phosphate cyclase domain-containing protein n=1 Tax=Tortispora caseinolytica NRRL Y-17796 TaxID=767744 RepID=A0A1E4TCD7_9ASCO|nr:hypothetical protein CANCADRAFT_148540 [Tortispora caseinolytica NRRL Y-17796]
MLTFQGHEYLRQRMVLATLLGKPLKVEKIRSDLLEPGLKDYEISFIRLLDRITNGSVMDISYTGTTVIYRPGMLVGGTHNHTCPTSRGIGYFLEPMLYLAPFCKTAMKITFAGVTSNETDNSVDMIRTSLFPVMQKFGIDRMELRIVRRGSPPLGGGEVVFSAPHLVLQPKTLHATTTPKILKIRGIAYSTRVSPTIVNRMINAAREVLKVTECETFIYSDVARGQDAGKSPGYGILLVAETKSGWCYSTEDVGAAGAVPEDLGEKVAKQLLYDISLGGVVGRNQIALALTFMILGKEDVGRIRVGRDVIDDKTVQLLRDIYAFTGQQIIIKDGDEDTDSNDLMISVKGIGFTSASKKIA